MATYVTFSSLNTFALVETDPNTPARYKRGHLGTSWQKDLILSFQPEQIYQQKVSRGNRVRFTFNAETAAVQKVYIVDCDGIEALELTGMTTADVPGALSPNGSQLHSYKYAAADLSAITDDGTYYLLVQLEDDIYISHPFLLKDSHEGTIVHEYWHTENLKGTYFEQLPTHYVIEYEAYIGKPIAKNSRTVYSDQDEVTEQLNRKAHKEFPLYIGHTGEGIPDWLYDKLNEIQDCDHHYYDGVQYVGADGADFKRDTSDQGVLSAYTYNIAPVNNTGEQAFGFASFSLFTVPSYPFAIQSISIGKNSPSIPLPVVAEIADLTALTAWITALNTDLPDYELYGTVSNDSGTIIYTNGTGEDYNIATSAIYTTAIIATVDTSALFADTLEVFVAMGSPVINWGDGDVETDYFDPTLTQSLSHLYASPGPTLDVKIWGPMEGFKMDDTARTDLTGDVPAGLKVFEVNQGTMASNTFDADFLIPCADTLTRIKVTNAGLTAIPNFNTTSFPVLARWDFSGNALPQSVYNALFYDVLFNNDTINGGWNNQIMNGVLNLAVQTTNPSLTSVGAGAMTTLQVKYGWNVIP